jgi:hypothetical protein
MKMIAALALIALGATAAPARAHFDAQAYEGEFDMDECACYATHILVVSPQGSVLEVWKGSARPGEVIPIHALANLTITQSKGAYGGGLGGWKPLPLSLSAWEPGCDRLILFLIKSDSDDPSAGLLEGWFPASRRGFQSSIARVQWPGSVHVQPTRWTGGSGIPDSGFRGSEEYFRASVFGTLDLLLRLRVAGARAPEFNELLFDPPEPPPPTDPQK